MSDKIIEMLVDLKKQLGELKDQLTTSHLRGRDPYRSEEVKDLYAALSKAQGEMPPVYSTKENTYLQEHYLDYGHMRRTVVPSLSKHGLSVFDILKPTEDGQEMLHMTLTHETGQWIESRKRIVPPRLDTTTQESYLNKVRKMMLCGLVGIVGARDDDDGEFADATYRVKEEKGVALNTNYNPKVNRLEVITKEQREEIEVELKSYTDIAEQILSTLRIRSLADMPKDQYRKSIERIRTIVRRREGENV